MHPSKRLNARIQTIEKQLKDIGSKVDQLSTERDDDHRSCRLGSEDRQDMLEEIDSKWDDLEASLLIRGDGLERDIAEEIDEMSAAFKRARDEFEIKTYDLVSDVAHDTAKDVVKDAVKDVLNDDITKMVNEVVNDGMKDVLTKVVKEAVEDVVKDMKEKIVKDIKKALMKGIALGLNLETE